MKIIFLDIDGVLNSHRYVNNTTHNNKGIYIYLDVTKLKLLKSIVEQTDAEIVLSSSWREAFDEGLNPTNSLTKNLLLALAEHNLVLLDRTPFLNKKRGSEIRSWLARHQKVNSFLILDDGNYDWSELTKYLVKTSYFIGLTERHVTEAVSILNQS